MVGPWTLATLQRSVQASLSQLRPHLGRTEVWAPLWQLHPGVA